ncbi:hypothetical protein [Rosistilla oblonga]|uniref:hypothetical protein n=1 Tax=Rosistilla oblonga TaxID=2527990 RepID=UPI003A97CBF7
MKLLAVIACIFVLPSLATGDESGVSRQYKPFQGRWKVTADVKVAPIKLDVPEIYVDVVGRSFVLHGADVAPNYRRAYEYRVPADGDVTPYQYLHERGTGNLGDIIDTPNQITVFWFVGIFRFAEDRLELCLRYCGQGVEGEAAQTFRPPTSFDAKQTKDTGIIILERVPVDDDELLTKESTDG